MTGRLKGTAAGLLLAATIVSAAPAREPDPRARNAGNGAAPAFAARTRRIADVSLPVSAKADRRLLERVLDEGGVDRAERRLGWRDYGVDLGRAFGRWLSDVLAQRAGALRGVGRFIGYALLGIAGLAVVGGIGVLVRLLWKRSPRRPTRAHGGVAASWPGGERLASAEAWLARAEERIAAGDVPGALCAVWWWLALAVTSGEADPSWTTLEMLGRAGRLDLRKLGLAMDRMRFGPDGATAEDVRQLVQDVGAFA